MEHPRHSAPFMAHPRSIVILDFGGQYAHLIARRIRQCGVYSEIRPPETPADDLRDSAGIILSGGPQSVYDEGSPQANPAILHLGVPVLGLCYGLHWMTQALGGTVKAGKVKEYGRTEVCTVNGGGFLLASLKRKKREAGSGKREAMTFTVWMSHGDEAVKLPEGFARIATSNACANAAFADERRKLFALQFHPEVTHTEHGQEILARFVALCDAAPWSVGGYAKEIEDTIRREVGDRKAFMLVSGGVDSSVAFTLLNKVLGADRVQGLLIDTGLMRKDEVERIREAFDALRITNLHIEDASEEFFANLEGVADPEEKRQVIGRTFLDVQRRVSKEMNLRTEDGWMFGQGTIYPDTIETGATRHADRIKTHHNRVEAVQKMISAGLVIEPLKDLYKDEVRALGEEIGLPHELVWRHPFPGPGLGVRILCKTEEDTKKSAKAGSVRMERHRLGKDGPAGGTPQVALPRSAILLPIRSVGVQGDGRTYRRAVALFNAAKIPMEEHRRIATEIPNSDKEVNRVVFCLSHAKPPEIVPSPGFVTRARADLLREADAIVDEEMRAAGLYEKIWQFPVVLLPFGTARGGQSIALRPVESQEAMTANAASPPPAVLKKITARLLARPGIDMVFLDLTDKPPATIEWE